jgi:hypothetical protein
MQTPSVYWGSNAIYDHCTIAHITVPALCFVQGLKLQCNKIQFVKTGAISP